MKKSNMREYSRKDLLALTPGKYLAKGFTDAKGKPKPELQTDYATAAATQLLAGKVSAQELAFVYEALRQTLPLHKGSPPEKIQPALEEALEIVRGMIQQPNNPALVKWIGACAAAVKRPQDINALVDHIQAALRQYTAILISMPA
jgi:hypothetical protein